MSIIVPANRETIALAAKIIREGGLVAFPTETVYGLGANALSSKAVASIYIAKGRPSNNPIIVHISKIDQLSEIAQTTPEAQILAEKFWPGPLTLVLQKKHVVPSVVTGGGSTVGVRMPRHPVALNLIQAAGLPIAAPSANRSEHISPTTAEHVAASLGDHLDLILDGGSCDVGLESTVLDLVSNPPRILRPGRIGAEEIEEALGGVRVGAQPMQSSKSMLAPAMSPGQMPRHYAPDKPCGIVDTVSLPQIESHPETGFIVRRDSKFKKIAEQSQNVIVLPSDSFGYASGFYSALHHFDSLPSIAEVVIEQVPNGAKWVAVRDRMKRSAAKKQSSA
jgi:L-threonylcarbamoyladenylate synthase